MNLVEAMEMAKNTGDLVARKDKNICFVHSERYKGFLWCFPSGRAIENKDDSCGYRRVVLTDDLLYTDYYLQPNPYNREMKTAKYKIGDKFLIPSCGYIYVIGNVVTVDRVSDYNNVRYTLRLDSRERLTFVESELDNLYRLIK